MEIVFDQRRVPVEGGQLHTGYVTMNVNTEPFDDVRVRQAVNMAINKDRIVRIINGRAVPANQPLPPAMPGYDKNYEGYPYDPVKAKALLAEAGYPDGLTEVTLLAVDEDGNVLEDEVEATIPLTLYWQPATRPYNPDGEGIGQAMAADLALKLLLVSEVDEAVIAWMRLGHAAGVLDRAPVLLRAARDLAGIGDDAAIIVKYRVKNQGAKLPVVLSFRRRDVLDNGLQK